MTVREFTSETRYRTVPGSAKEDLQAFKMNEAEYMLRPQNVQLHEVQLKNVQLQSFHLLNSSYTTSRFGYARSCQVDLG